MHIEAKTTTINRAKRVALRWHNEPFVLNNRLSLGFVGGCLVGACFGKVVVGACIGMIAALIIEWRRPQKAHGRQFLDLVGEYEPVDTAAFRLLLGHVAKGELTPSRALEWIKAEEAALAISERRETQRAWPEAKQFLQQHHAYSEQEPTKG